MSTHWLSLGDYRVSPSQELLLQVLFLDKEAALTAWKQWQSMVDIEVLDPQSYLLLPQMYQNLLAHDVKDADMARLKGIYRRSWYANQLQIKQLKTLLSHLKNADIDAIVLGDAAFCDYHLDELQARKPDHIESYRPLSSFHLLVHADHLEKAIQKLADLNWQTLTSDQDVGGSFIHLQDGQQHSLYLQTHLFWANPQDYTDQQVWGAATQNWSNQLGWRLSPTDQFLDSAARMFFKSRSHQIYGIADVMMLIQNRRDDLDWIRLVMQAQRYQLILPVRNMLILLQQMFQISVPEWVLPTLDQMPIAEAEWLKYQVLAGDPRALRRSAIAKFMYSLSYLQTQLLQLRYRPFLGRQVLKNILKPQKLK